jgi:hypothetical protein
MGCCRLVVRYVMLTQSIRFDGGYCSTASKRSWKAFCSADCISGADQSRCACTSAGYDGLGLESSHKPWPPVAGVQHLFTHSHPEPKNLSIHSQKRKYNTCIQSRIEQVVETMVQKSEQFLRKERNALLRACLLCFRYLESRRRSKFVV